MPFMACFTCSSTYASSLGTSLALYLHRQSHHQRLYGSHQQAPCTYMYVRKCNLHLSGPVTFGGASTAILM